MCGSQGLFSQMEFVLHIINFVVVMVVFSLSFSITLSFINLFPADTVSVSVCSSYLPLFCFILFWWCCFPPGQTVRMILNQSSEACFVSLYLTEQMSLLFCRWDYSPGCCERGKHLELVKFCYNMVIHLHTLTTAPIVFLWRYLLCVQHLIFFCLCHYSEAWNIMLYWLMLYMIGFDFIYFY